MKVVHLDPDAEGRSEDPLQRGKKAEEEEDWETAIGIYEKLLKLSPRNETAYRRLMIIYRKTRKPKKELAIIKRAIHSFEEMLRSNSRHAGNKKIISISKRILHSVGQMDVEPVSGWKKRKRMVENLVKRSGS